MLQTTVSGSGKLRGKNNNTINLRVSMKALCLKVTLKTVRSFKRIEASLAVEKP